MANDEEGQSIMAQVFIAFGQGTGSMRVSRAACAALRKRYEPMLERAKALWDTEGVQALERIRALGRMMAARTVGDGKTVIAEEYLAECADSVERASSTLEAQATQICNPPPTGA